MAEDIGLQIPITADTNPFKQAMNGLQTNMAASMEGVKSSLANVKLAFGAVGLMAADYLKGAVESATKAQKATADVEQTIKSTGGAAGMTAKQVNDMAAGFAKTTLFGSAAIKTGDAMLLTFTNIGKDVLPLATDAMLNMATKMKTDPVNSAMQLGKALNDPVKGLTALTRVGVTFSTQQKEQIKTMQAHGDMAGAQKIILAELSKEFGGQAVAATKTYDGQLQMMTKSLAGIKTSIGMAVLPYLQLMAEKIQAIVTPIANFLQEHAKLSAAILSITAVLGLFIGGAGLVQKVMGIMGPVVSGLTTALAGMALPIVAIIAVIALLGVAYAKNFGGMKTAVDGFIASSMKFLLDVFSQVKAWVIVHLPEIKAGFKVAFDAILVVVSAVGNFIKTVLVPILATLVQWVIANLPAIKATFGVVFEGIQVYWESVLKPVLSFVITELGVVVDWVKENWPLIKDTVMIVFNTIKSVVTTVLGAVFVIISAVIKSIVDFWKTHWDTISAVLTAVWDIIKTVVDTAIHVVMDVIKIVMDIINGKWGDAWDALVDAVKRIFGGLGIIISDVLDGIGAIFSDLANTAINWGANLIGGFVTGIKNAAYRVTDAVSSVINGVKDFLGFNSPAKEGEGQHIVEWGANMVGGFMQGIKSQIPSMQALMAGVIQSPNLKANVKLTGGYSGSSVGAMSSNQTTHNHLHVTMPGMVIRQEADIDKIAQGIFRLNQNRSRSLGVPV